MKRLILNILTISLLLLFSSLAAHSQNNDSVPSISWCQKHNVFNKLDVGISLGTTGLGINLKTPVTKWLDVRAGVSWIPAFKIPLAFDLNTYSDGVPTGNFNNVAQMLYDNTGIKMDETINMKGRGTMTNFSFMVDVFPIPANHHWHLTAGFLLGTSKIGKAYNIYDEKPSLVALNIYNRAYEFFTHLESIFDVPVGGGATLDPVEVMKIQERFAQYGRMGIHIGDFKDGTPYIMEPAPDGSLSAEAFVDHFKPYLGAGYCTDLDRKGKWSFGVDLGVLFWGGKPDIIHYDYNNHQEINFSTDLINIRGKVGDYVKIIKSFPVYPVLEIRFSYNIL